jgi:hypothetical protein
MEQDIHEAGFEEFNIRSQEALRLTMRTVQKQLALVRRLLQHSRAAVTHR